MKQIISKKIPIIKEDLYGNIAAIQISNLMQISLFEVLLVSSSLPLKLEISQYPFFLQLLFTNTATTPLNTWAGYYELEFL